MESGNNGLTGRNVVSRAEGVISHVLGSVPDLSSVDQTVLGRGTRQEIATHLNVQVRIIFVL